MPRIRLKEPRLTGRAPTISARLNAGTASVREACLIGPPAFVRGLAEGGPLVWHGRGYHVRAVDGGGPVPCYAHLTVVAQTSR
jgi:hypothetical protein